MIRFSNNFSYFLPNYSQLWLQVLQTIRELNLLERCRANKLLSVQDQINQVCLACVHLDDGETPLKHNSEICKKVNVKSGVGDFVVQSDKENVPTPVESDQKQPQQPSKSSKKKKKKKSKANAMNVPADEAPVKQNSQDEKIPISIKQQQSLSSQVNDEIEKEVSRIIKEIEEITKQKVLLHKVNIF